MAEMLERLKFTRPPMATATVGTGISCAVGLSDDMGEPKAVAVCGTRVQKFGGLKYSDFNNYCFIIII